jgi:hypothetical protein
MAAQPYLMAKHGLYGKSVGKDVLTETKKFAKGVFQMFPKGREHEQKECMAILK